MSHNNIKKKGSIMSNQFDCHKFIEKLSIPRIPGSVGEAKAQELIEAELESLKIDNYKKESFIYTRFFIEIRLAKKIFSTLSDK